METASVEEAERSLSNQVLARASAIIFGTGSADPSKDAWLRDQVACVRNIRPDVPIVLFTETAELLQAELALKQLQLSGYIPTSSSLELAATALRLIIAGGHCP